MIPSEPSSEGPKLITFGCRLNFYESEIMRRHARASGLDKAIIINTCAVTAEAERQARQGIRRARRRYPDTPIIVTGCSVQINPSVYAKMPEVTRVIGNAEKLKQESFTLDKAPRVVVNDIMSVNDTANHLIGGFDSRARAFVQVQQGCNHRCTFCTIPFGRGPSRSVQIGDVVSQIRDLIERGHQEVVLTGVDISDYGKDLPNPLTLGVLVRKILRHVPELPRLRLSSLDGIEIDGELMQLLEEEQRLMPHLHLSVQAGDDTILKRMKRRHLRSDIINLCKRLRKIRPDIVFGADFITGFPTESEDMFKCTMNLIAECGFTWLHVFPYSERPGTPAARMPQVPVRLRRERAARLRKVGFAEEQKFLNSKAGKEVSILVEHKGEGRTEHYARAKIVNKSETHMENLQGKIVAAKVLSIENQSGKAKSLNCVPL